MTERVATLPLERPEDVFALRQSGRVAARAIGCDEAAQVRFATALSELGREALARGISSTATFELTGESSLLVHMRDFPREGSRVDDSLVGLVAARKLVDEVIVSDEAATSTITVILRTRLSRRGRIPPENLRRALLEGAAPRPLDELRLENRDLIATLSEVKAQQEQLVRLNAELEETNRGVMAMYAQLADELEETNRGVVALYAELDDKTVRLNEASEAKSRFLANVSHELRSPVNSILGLVRLLADPDEGAIGEEERKQLSLIQSSGSELLRLVNELLDLAKAESGRLEPEVSAVDVSVLLSELRGSLRPLARSGVDLEFSLEPLPLVETDGVLLNQVLRNLLTNALKFTPAGSVRLFARASSPHEVEIAVTDTGIGISPADQPKIFEEFYQVRGPLQRDQRGTGLGLPYARRVTQTLGGRMTLESAPGLGSTFTVHLPTQWQPLLRAPRTPGSVPPVQVRVGSVLIVDDDESFRTFLRGLLQGVAGSVLEAGGGVEGLRMMRESPPDLAFVDLWMPDMDGAQVIAAMTSDPRLRVVSIVVVTSALIDVKMRSALSGSATLLSKADVTPEIVRRVIGEALGVETAER